MADILKEAGANSGSLYHFFPTKQDVLLAVLEMYRDGIYPMLLAPAWEGVEDPIERVFALLAAYRSGLIKATENFKLGVVAATGGICLLYLVSFGLSFFNIPVPMIHSGGTAGIIFSLVVVVIAALNLVLDFDFIETGVEKGAPKHMEWYGAFGLMVTLVWLYLEFLRLLSKLQSR